jgi:hypothetical protein
MLAAVSVERQLPGKTSLSVVYRDQRTTHILQTVNINAPPPWGTSAVWRRSGQYLSIRVRRNSKGEVADRSVQQQGEPENFGDVAIHANGSSQTTMDTRTATRTAVSGTAPTFPTHIT